MTVLRIKNLTANETFMKTINIAELKNKLSLTY